MWEGILSIHLLAMATFIGGQLFLAIAVIPVERRTPDRKRTKEIARRFGWMSLVALVVLLATGCAMAEHYRLWNDSLLEVKLGLFAAVGILIIWHLRHPSWHLLDALILLCSLAILSLGVLIAN